MKKITVEKNNVKQRIDKFLSEELFLYTRGEIIKNIKNRNILVNDKKVKPSYALKENDEIIINISKKKSKLVPNKKIKLDIIHNDNDIVVINKPAGVKVHPSSFDEVDTLVNGLLAKFPEIENINDGSFGSEFRPGIVHRLDKDTSGVMIIAKNQEAFKELKKLFKERKVIKIYTTLVYGKMDNKSGTIKKPIAKASSYKKQVIAGKKTKTKVRPAITEYKVLKEYDDYSLIEAVPKTGRTHQIRVHLFSLKHPIVGDEKYKLRRIENKNKPKRQLLHAKSIKLKLGKKNYSFTTDVPRDFADFIKNLD